MYFPFFVLHDWGKRSAEARSPHLSGVALENGSGNRQNACLSGAAPDGRVPFTVLSLPFLKKMCYDTLRV